MMSSYCISRERSATITRDRELYLRRRALEREEEQRYLNSVRSRYGAAVSEIMWVFLGS